MADFSFGDYKPTGASDFLAAWQKGQAQAGANADAARMRGARQSAMDALNSGDRAKAAMILGIAGDDKSSVAVGNIAHNQAGDDDTYAKNVAGSVASVLDLAKANGTDPQIAFNAVKGQLIHMHGIDPNIVDNFNANDPTHIAWLHAQAGYGYDGHARAQDANADRRTTNDIADDATDNNRAERSLEETTDYHRTIAGNVVRGQDLTHGDRVRGQDMGYGATTRGQDLTHADRGVAHDDRRYQADLVHGDRTRGQDMTDSRGRRGQDMAAAKSKGGHHGAGAATGAQYHEGQVATGPNGKSFVFKQGKWYPR